MNQVLEALLTSAGILWQAFWALVFGYTISAGIQILVTRSQMAKILGKRGPKRGMLAGFFGFISSSCSFAALAASRSILVKGAHPVNAISFLIASTNLVIELGIVLWVLMGWHFVVGNFLLGILMIVYAYIFTRFWFPQDLAEAGKQHAEEQQNQEGMQQGMEENGNKTWWDKITSKKGWYAIADAFFMEWKMAYREILFGFTIAGFISVFVPQSFWNSLFLQTGNHSSILVLLENAFIAPIIAFFTFIGSMGNVPLAAMLWGNNATFGGVMSFLGADLVAATVIYLNAKYYGWKYAAYLSGLLYVCMATAGITVHGIFALFNIIPTQRPQLRELVRFQIDYTFWLNIIFLVIGGILLYLHWKNSKRQENQSHNHQDEHHHATHRR